MAEGNKSYCWNESRGLKFSHMAAWRLRAGRFMEVGLVISRWPWRAHMAFALATSLLEGL